MKKTWMTLATLALALSPSLALAHPVQNTGTRTANPIHDHTPVVHDHSGIVH